jgi:hypothetical protein
MRREVFETDHPDFRIVCKIGHMGLLGNVWWCYFQRARRFKRYLFFGPTVIWWDTIHAFYFNAVFNTLEELKTASLAAFEHHSTYWSVYKKNASIK